jgi:hypothetical protein
VSAFFDATPLKYHQLIAPARPATKRRSSVLGRGTNCLTPGLEKSSISSAVLLGTKHRLMLLCMQIVGKSVARENAVES